MWNSVENLAARSASFREEGDDEEALRWAALERLPTYTRVRRGIFRNILGDSKEIDVEKLQLQEHKIILDRLFNSAEEDWEKFFRRLRRRFERVNLDFPKIEVRFHHLTVESFVHLGSRALPTIPNFIFNMTEALFRQLRISSSRRELKILDDISGIIRPGRLTLLLGPPSSGKTTLLLALAGRLKSNLQMSGEITYNGHGLNEFVPQKTAAYVSQQDWHVAEMTVRETLDVSARCQGVGYRYDMLLELARREKIAGIKPDEDLDIFVKAMALEGKETGLVVEYILKILGLDVCADTLVGDEMLKGISGGQKKRLTTGELLVGPSRVLLMDEISTGLDSSTTYQIVKYLRHSTCALGGTTVISLLQPAPETYELFDDIILLSEGQIVYQGPRGAAPEFFAYMGFYCPKRKNVADFLQEVLSEKDQQQYWAIPDCPHDNIPVSHFVEAFRFYSTGKNLREELDTPFDKRFNHPAALSTSKYGVKKMELLKTSFDWQLLLMKRNSFIYVFKFIQLLLVALITMSVFLRTTMHHETIEDGGLYLGEIYFSMVIILFNGFTEVSMLVAKLPVLYKHRDLHFYPCWIYTLPSWALSIPTSLIESGFWVAVTYYVVGFDPNITRFFRQFFLFFFLHQMSLALFRLMATLGRNMIVANTFGSFAMLIVMVLGGYIISRDRIPAWWIWGFWISPLMYAQDAASVNEFIGHSWDKRSGDDSNLSLGTALLKSRSLFPESYWYWIGVGALVGYIILFNILFTFFLSYLNPLVNHQTIVSKEKLQDKDQNLKGQPVVLPLKDFLQYSGSLARKSFKQKGMVLPFQPLAMSFSNINYHVDVPLELKQKGILEDKLQLLNNITGAFRPGVLTALVGESGAGKTTLMDVLAGRKTGGIVEGSINISGYPKKQETFARISGYCEQNDIHSPCLTVLESLLFSAWLRLASDIDLETQKAFVEEVMELVELFPLRGALVGLPGVDGLSTEQRKRLTIAVELVANPSIVFMDEPTSGLDARSAAIVMRTVRNIVNTGRTIVCTIHQPSIDIFESFDELLLMKRGGELIYAGPLGPKSSNLIEYFEGVDGVPRIRPGYNPATWILEVTTSVEEARLGVDFAEIYRRSHLFECNKELVESLSKPSSDTKDLNFPTKYSQSYFDQFVACLWKQNLSYWRNPQYTAVRFFYTLIISLMLGTICWQFGSKRDSQQDIFNAMGSMYAAVLFIGVTNATSVQPVVSVERFVSYRERAAGMYSALPFAFAQVAIEFPYVFMQSLVYCTIFYSMASFEWTASKFIWYTFFMYFSMLYFTFYGMMTTAVTPNHNVAAIIAAPFYMLWNLFSGFMIPHKRIPIWWRWYYWANPVAWSLYGLVASQYSDSDKLVKLSDGIHTVSTKLLLKNVFGFQHDFIGIGAIMVVGFCLLFAVIFAYAIKSFNFLKR
ncbi:ABC transporter G family member 32-like isoform X1 [Olea europaea var. sylvestris]|uniref:ABC transporter G family member 32-like isoform X1 n=3 Tax=Olea europaea var. sylvestris TaxID=158386 RepID=UPI000C1D460E|nr:ABC transporter G family member 32-like isoform X1 [Olea europaea var. sylvestris]